MKNIFTIVCLLLVGFMQTGLYAQVGFNNPDPNKYSVIDAKGEQKGVLIPRLSSGDITNMEVNQTVNDSLPEGLMVYDSVRHQFFQFNREAGHFQPINAWEAASIVGKYNYYLTNVNKVGVGTNDPRSYMAINGAVTIGEGYTDNDAPKNGLMVESKVNIANADTTGDYALKVGGNIESTGAISGFGISPIGSITLFAGPANKVPDGWLICDGSVKLQADYPDLFAVISNLYNAGGVGATQFTLPNLSQKFPVGAKDGAIGDYALGGTGGSESVKLTIDELPAHNHGINDPGHAHDFSEEGVNVDSEGDDASDNPTTDPATNTSTTATATTGITIQNTGGDKAHENRPPFISLFYIIRAK